MASVYNEVEEDKVTQLMRSHGTALLRTCFVILRDKHLAEDAVQDTFIKAFRNIGRFEKHAEWSEKAWLLRIAVNICKDYQRTKWFKHVDRRINPDDLPATTEITIGEGSFANLLHNLPRKYREVILLRYYHEQTVDEIVKILGVPKSTVYSRLDKARRVIRSNLNGGTYNEAQ
ncbi:MAG: sigma-70 family RNA polymerase sigma factor [Oscillospiraceae bacterium]|jgi:RNA polymerase sigma-70 factor (ECF subfamily)|nr:sigma-70 family RNA polymerase sigma factor [Oscillospiraceae bacterium]